MIRNPVLDATGRQVETRVKFSLTGRVPRDEEEVLLTMARA
ncbi:MAG: hypothetical protein RBU27_13245 [Bacteroidota bacterium]|nr:hypothetical protein [Bacteroidota bacterium]